ncbi:hypothetical protein [Nocardia transvalensis]|uniref:hypothetical protein n=1 Tax=Nocardia transvalensis TaxID=37333 RepID=UPI00189434FD|nr:hypothetical protein [Nocardia transvalensis]MBF6333751.1 hypothetical protein [Nocardia transvalensis]
MMRRLWIVVDLVLILLCVGAAVPSWRNGMQTTWFTASEELPAFQATRYVGPWIALAALLVAIAGVAVVDLIARCASRSR